ncbi:MAG: hypothetical protein ACT4OP_01905 [Actinomycetota bacterium]
MTDSSIPSTQLSTFSQLPGAVRNLLAPARQLHIDEMIAADPAGLAFFVEDPSAYCYDISTEEARTLAATLDTGADLSHLVSGSLPEPQDYPAFDAIILTLWPMLPHGVPAFTGA